MFFEIVRQVFHGEVTVEHDFDRSIRIALGLPGLNNTIVRHQFVISDIELRNSGNLEQMANMLRARIAACRRDMANHLLEQAEELYTSRRSLERFTSRSEFGWGSSAEEVSLERLAAVAQELDLARTRTRDSFPVTRGPELQETDPWHFEAWQRALPVPSNPVVIRHDVEPTLPPKTRAELLKEDPF